MVNTTENNVIKNIPWVIFFFFFLFLGCFAFGWDDVVVGVKDSVLPFNVSSLEVEESETHGQRLPGLLGPGWEQGHQQT